MNLLLNNFFFFRVWNVTDVGSTVRVLDRMLPQNTGEEKVHFSFSTHLPSLLFLTLPFLPSSLPSSLPFLLPSSFLSHSLLPSVRIALFSFDIPPSLQSLILTLTHSLALFYHPFLPSPSPPPQWYLSKMLWCDESGRLHFRHACSCSRRHTSTGLRTF